jgi:hypothetical protein
MVEIAYQKKKFIQMRPIDVNDYSDEFLKKRFTDH